MERERKVIKEIQSHAFSGMPPAGFASWQEFAESIPVYEGVDREGLYELDSAAGTKPFHVVLDVFKYNVTSENGLVYDDDFVNELLSQLPGKGAIFGHVPEWETSTAFPIESADWIGHIRVEDTIYAKAYIPPGQHRDFVHRIMKRRGKLRTSLQGAGYEIPVLSEMGEPTGQYRLTEFELSRLDFAPAEGSALRKHQSGLPVFASETIQEGAGMPTTIGIADVPASVREQIIKEAQVGDAVKRVSELELQVKEMQTARETAAAEMKKLMDAAVEKDRQIAELTTARDADRVVIAEYQQREFTALVDGIVSSYTANWNLTSETAKQKVAVLHSLMRAPLLQIPVANRTAEQVKEFAQGLWDQQFQVIAETMQQALMGPAGFVPPKHNQPGSTPALEMTDESMKALKFKWGIN